MHASAPVENLSTVAIIAVSDDVPVSNFALELMHSLNSIGKLTHSFQCRFKHFPNDRIQKT